MSTFWAGGMLLVSPQKSPGGGEVGGGDVGGGDVGGVTVPVMWTVNSHSEYPYAVPRAVPYMRMYRPEPFTLSVCTPPVPVVVLKMLVQLAASADTWIWNDRPYAASQLSTTWQTVAVAPRSICSHCGSEN